MASWAVRAAVADSRAKQGQYAGPGMVGTAHRCCWGAAKTASTGLIGGLGRGVAEAIAARSENTVSGVAGEDELLDLAAAIEPGTD